MKNLNREKAREYFQRCDLDYSMVTMNDIDKLVKLLDEELQLPAQEERVKIMLNEIKKDFEWGIKAAGKGQGHTNLDDEQVLWFIEQAEKLEKIQKFANAEDITIGEFTKITLSIIEDRELSKRKERS